MYTALGYEYLNLYQVLCVNTLLIRISLNRFAVHKRGYRGWTGLFNVNYTKVTITYVAIETDVNVFVSENLCWSDLAIFWLC